MLNFEQAIKYFPMLREGSVTDAAPWEIGVVRDLAKRYAEACASQKNQGKIRFWRAFNDLQGERPAVYSMYHHAAKELLPLLEPFETIHLRAVEAFFKYNLWHHDHVYDDAILSPFLLVTAVMQSEPGFWGLDLDVTTDAHTQSWASKPVITCMEDIERIRFTPHRVLDGDPPLARAMRDYVGDILPVHVRRISKYRWFGEMGFSFCLLALLGYEEFLYLMLEEPDLVHALLAKLQQGLLANFDGVKAAGDWAACDMFNYSMLPTASLAPPTPGAYTDREEDLWFFTHAQEFDVVGPDLFKEFMLDYQQPVMERFGLSSYGCCEDLANKMEHLRRVKNLRKVGVGPRADIGTNIEAIGKDYVISWRPFPNTVDGIYDPEGLRATVRDGLTRGKGTHMEIILKDILSFSGKPERMVTLSRVCMEEATR